MRKKRTALIFGLFFLLGIASRVIFAVKDFTHLDEVLYAIGSVDFSVKNATPPSPGYFLYIMSARFLNIFTNNPHTSLMALSIIYSGAIAGLIYYFAKLLKSEAVGIIAALLFLTSPLFWYKGVTIFGYLNSGFFILLTALLGWRIVVEKKTGLLFWFSLSFAILTGVRPQEFPIMLPLYIFVLTHLNIREAIGSIFIFGLTCCAWLIPLLIMSGGLREYISVLSDAGGYVAYDSIFGGSFTGKLNNHLVRMERYFIWAYFLGVIPFIYYIGKFFYIPNLVNEKKAQFFAVWLFPALIYNVFIQFGEIGHGMSWGLGFLIIIAEAIMVISEDALAALLALSRKGIGISSAIIQSPYVRKITSALVVGPIIIFNCFIFFHDFDKDKHDFYDFRKYRQFNYNDVLKKSHFLKSKVDFIKKNFNQKNIAVLVTGTFGHQVMYHLPDALIIQAGVIMREDHTSFSTWRRLKQKYYENANEFIIPEGIQYLVLFDDIFVPYLKNTQDNNCYRIDDTHKLFVHKVSPGERFNFAYHSIAVN